MLRRKEARGEGRGTPERPPARHGGQASQESRFLHTLLMSTGEGRGGAGVSGRGNGMLKGPEKTEPG